MFESCVAIDIYNNIKAKSEHLRTNLKVLDACTNQDQLEKLTSKLDLLISDFYASLPKAEGLILRPQARFAARNRAREIKHKYLNLTLRLKRGRAKSDWRY